MASSSRSPGSDERDLRLLVQTTATAPTEIVQRTIFQSPTMASGGNDHPTPVDRSTDDGEPSIPTPSNATTDLRALEAFYSGSALKAEKAIERLGIAGEVLDVAGDVLACMPITGPASGVCSLLSRMLCAARAMYENRLDALGLVHDSITIVDAVQRRIKSGPADVSPDMKARIQGLYKKLSHNTELLEKFVNRSRFKLFLYAGRMQSQIEAARNDTLWFISRFSLEAVVSLDALLQEARQQREQDRQEFISRLGEFTRNPEAARHLLENVEVPEVMVTLRREVHRQFQIAYRSATPIPERHPEVAWPIPHPYHPGGREEIQAGPLPPQPTWSGRGWQDRLPRRAWHGSRDGPDVEESTGVFCREFLNYLESESQHSQIELPPWVITEYEVYRDERISTSHFAKVWRGRWHDQEVAIKDLDPLTDKPLFLAEVEVWSQLEHQYILPFYGAASTQGPPPWFLVSPWKKNGRITDYLRTDAGRNANLITILCQIAHGMAYLHDRNIIHGDLKGQNILIDEEGQPLLCDFGLSQIKVGITSKSATPPPDELNAAGTLRFQAPERLRSKPLSKACDVYSFAMTVFQLYSHEVPFAALDANSVRKTVIDGGRPSALSVIPGAIWSLLQRCWDTEPLDRPTFIQIANELEGLCALTSPLIHPVNPLRRHSPTLESLSMSLTDNTTNESDDEAYETAQSEPSHSTYTDDSGGQDKIADFELDSNNEDIETPSTEKKSLTTASETIDQDVGFEKVYRESFKYADFPDQLNVPLWSPSEIALGSIGYIDAVGHFVKLSHVPAHLMDDDQSPASQGSQRRNRTTMEKAINSSHLSTMARDIAIRVITSLKPNKTLVKTVRRQVPVSMTPGMRTAKLILVDGKFEMMMSCDTLQKYLQRNVDALVHEAESQGHSDLERSDIVLIVGTLTACNYAMAVCDHTPGAHLNFNIMKPTRGVPLEPWGFWTISHDPVSLGSGSSTPRKSASVSSRLSELAATSEVKAQDDESQHAISQHFWYSVKTSKPGGPRA
ncbi:hypothetical protein IAU60_005736 [Kwoniella sp. DSM 27419]